MSLKPRILTSLADIPATQWDALANPDPAKFNPFVSHAFLWALENSGSATARTGWAAAHLIIEDGGKPVAAALCYLKSHSQGEYVFDQGWADAFERAGGHYYPKLQVSVPFSPVTAPKLLAPTESLRKALATGLVSMCKNYDASAVQITMIGAGLARGERFTPLQIIGVALAIAGLIGLVLPGLAAPPLTSAALMIIAGIAWGVYSLRGAGATDPLHVTAGNFLRTLPMTIIFSFIFFTHMQIDAMGVVCAVASGAITSGIGYAIWYGVLPHLRATQAATLQLSVPVIAAVAAVFLLGESASLRLVLASIAVLSGIALVIQQRGQIKRP